MASYPGYGGYVQVYQREHVTSADVPAHKYEDIAIAPDSLMSRTQYRTNAQVSYAHPSTYKRTSCRMPPGSKIFNAEANRTKTLASRQKYEYEVRPTHGWLSSSASQHVRYSPEDAALAQGQLPDLNTTDRGPVHMLTGKQDITSYSASFGRAGDNPRNHYVIGDGKHVISRRATTADNFVGTTKGSVRIPGYAGCLPNSHNNQGLLTEAFPANTKNNLLHTYNHNTPGYTGHQPQSVLNDYGPRTPASKRDPSTSLFTGLMLHSMRNGQ